MKNIVKIKPSEDKWTEFSYDSERVFDALSSLFNFNTPCGGAKIHQNILFLSYNTKSDGKEKEPIPKHQRNMVFEFMNHCTPDKLLCLYLLLNNNFNDFIKTYVRIEKEKSNKSFLYDVLSTFRSNFPKLKNDLQKRLSLKSEDEEYHQIDMSDFLKINKDYYLIVHKLKTEDSTSMLIEREILFRPFQDSLKIMHWFKDYKGQISSVEKLTNLEGLHTEYNIATHPKTSQTGGTYIGIELLCCALCDTYLNELNYKHRGTHGTCDPSWKLSISSSSETKDRLLTIGQEIAGNTHSYSQRRLSTDNIEKKISPPIDFIVEDFKHVSNIYDLKTELALIGNTPLCSELDPID